MDVTGSINRQSTATRDAARALWLGGVRLNLPELTWLVSCAIVNDHCSFQCAKAMPFCYLYTAGSGELVVRQVEQTEL